MDNTRNITNRGVMKSSPILEKPEFCSYEELLFEKKMDWFRCLHKKIINNYHYLKPTSMKITHTQHYKQTVEFIINNYFKEILVEEANSIENKFWMVAKEFCHKYTKTPNIKTINHAFINESTVRQEFGAEPLYESNIFHEGQDFTKLIQSDNRNHTVSQNQPLIIRGIETSKANFSSPLKPLNPPDIPISKFTNNIKKSYWSKIKDCFCCCFKKNTHPINEKLLLSKNSESNNDFSIKSSLLPLTNSDNSDNEIVVSGNNYNPALIQDNENI